MLFVLTWVLGIAMLPGQATNDLDVIKARLYQQYLAEQPEKKVAAVAELCSTLRADGSWGDLDYADHSAPGLRCIPHMHRLNKMVLAYRTKGTSDFGNPKLSQQIHAALQFWLQANPTTTHDFYNQIKVPQELSKTLILMEDELSADERAGGIQVLKRANCKGDGTLMYGPYPSTGVNLTWEAFVQVVAGALEGSPQYVATYAARASHEIQITPGEGLQVDWSFHQHGPQLFSGGYGQGFATDNTEFASILRETKFAFASQKADLLVHYVLDGQRWMTRGNTWDYGVMGRFLASSSRSARPLIATCKALALLSPARKDELLTFARQLDGDASLAPEGNRCFWRSDFMSHLRKDYYASARMHSKRVRGDEAGNGHNAYGYHMGDGAMCLMRTGQEYRNVFPFWNWLLVPGVTCGHFDRPLPTHTFGHFAEGTTDFAGGVSDGRRGASAFDFAKDGVSARKAWFFFDDAIVCLGAGISADTPVPVTTSVNQCSLNGPVTLPDATLALGESRQLDGQTWVHHDGWAYVFPRSATVRLVTERREGRWKTVNADSSLTGSVTGDVFGLWIDHGTGPANATYSYTILPNISADQTKSLAATPPATELVNTPQVQAASHERLGLVQVAFYESGQLDIGNGLSLAVDQPCMIMVRRDGKDIELTVGNPLAKEMDLTVTLSGTYTGQDAASDAAATRVRMHFPAGELAGQPIKRTLHATDISTAASAPSANAKPQ